MEAKLKHLEFIEAAIGRMATNSFLFKGWAITIASGLSGFGVVDTRPTLFAIALVTTVLFWALDAYYLWLEHGFIALYNKVAQKSPDDIDFAMIIDKSRPVAGWFDTCFRHHLVAFYGTIMVVNVVGLLLVRSL